MNGEETQPCEDSGRAAAWGGEMHTSPGAGMRLVRARDRGPVWLALSDDTQRQVM